MGSEPRRINNFDAVAMNLRPISKASLRQLRKRHAEVEAVTINGFKALIMTYAAIEQSIEIWISDLFPSALARKVPI